MSALIREPEPQQHQPQPPVPAAQPVGAAAAAPALAPSEIFAQVDIDLIDPSPFQPRTRFREEALEELSRSIRASGIVQPVVIRRIGNRYQLIAGERRWRAAQRAGLARVPAIVRDVRDEIALEMTLVENLQREDLNPVEQARALQRLADEFHLTQEEAAERTGKDRATIANSVRLLRLEDAILDLIEEGKISAGHARALLAVDDPKDRLELARKSARGGMTVRQLERHVARHRHPKPPAATAASAPDPNTKWAIEELQRKFGAKVVIHPLRPGHAGELAFEYYDDADLTRLYEQLMRQ
ncbi:MAG TPA: ParB/RepB/Spo0J family partition protein [Candidatus Acidoferrum sp.]|nr:ParB/RepB/Spo0J family partition protein [Candidatus Acidoferrum sp.]